MAASGSYSGVSQQVSAHRWVRIEMLTATVNTLGQSLAKSPELLLPRLPFSRLVREIVDAVSPTSHQLKLSEDAKEVLQEISEMWLLTVFGGRSTSTREVVRRTNITPSCRWHGLSRPARHGDA